MTPEQIIEAANKHCKDQSNWYVDHTELLRFAVTIRNAALEEAAKRIETLYDAHFGDKDMIRMKQRHQITLDLYAKEIRALKETK